MCKHVCCVPHKTDFAVGGFRGKCSKIEACKVFSLGAGVWLRTGHRRDRGALDEALDNFKEV